MNTFFALLFTLSAACLLFGLWKPAIFSKLLKHTFERKQIGIIFGAAAVVTLILFSVTAPAKQQDQEIKHETGLNVQTQETTTPVVEEKIETKTEAIPFTSTTENDPNLAQGQTQIKQAGQNGSKEVKTKVTYVDGKETKRETVSETITLQPVPQITSVGTYVAPPPAPSPAPTPAPSAGPPSGATARCNDGTYSYSAHRQGTCSHHGGVAEWY